MKYRAEQGYYASADLSGYGDMYLDLDNEYKRPAYELVNAKIGYETEKYDIYLYAKNLFDRNYDMEGQYYKTYSQPREIGMSVTYRL
jgi:iron complex outermembrane receptor protein